MLRPVLVILGVFAVLFGLPAVWGFFIEPNRLVVRQQAISVDDLPKLRVALLSDLHAGAPFIDEEKINQVVATINGGKPDLVLLLGDYVIGHATGDGVAGGRKMPIEKIVAGLARLRARLGVIAVLGNHDVWTNRRGIRAAFEEVGIRVLDDEAVRIDDGEHPFWVAGFADFMSAQPRPRQVVAAIPPGFPILGMSHSPDVFPEVPPEVPLLVAGHTHGGQVRVPYYGALVIPSKYGKKYASGLFSENGHLLYVTTGVGTSILPLRFNVPPEVVFLDVTPAEKRGAYAHSPMQ